MPATPSLHSLFLGSSVPRVHFYFLKYIKVTKTNEEGGEEGRDVDGNECPSRLGGGRFPFFWANHKDTAAHTTVKYGS